MNNQNKDETGETCKRDVAEANTCIGLGAGVGALGAGTALVTGATCPICWIAAPALVGIGLYKRLKNRHQQEKSITADSESE